MMKSLVAWIPGEKLLANGANASSKSAWWDWKNVPARVAPGPFPPELIVQVKALPNPLNGSLRVTTSPSSCNAWIAYQIL
jgi:hypothetical protein